MVFRIATKERTREIIGGGLIIPMRKPKPLPEEGSPEDLEQKRQFQELIEKKRAENEAKRKQADSEE